MSRDDLRRPLPLAYHPLYRFYEGGALTRQFRGLPQRILLQLRCLLEVLQQPVVHLTFHLEPRVQRC